ncbi:hypothetical protein Cus16_0031 [Curtobacterium sp. ER1/6]|nr:hypothetical protein Cus16_0031 [Curtobacterium sp. ER1/6]
MLVAERADGRGPELQHGSVLRREPDPGGAERAEHVPVGDHDRVVTLGEDRPHAVQHALDADADLRRVLARGVPRGHAVGPEVPRPVPLDLDLRGGQALVRAVVPLVQVLVELRVDADELRRGPRTLERAGQRERERPVGEVPAGALRLLDTVLGERDVGAAGVLTALRPLRLSVADEDEFAGAFRGHVFLPVYRPSAAAPTETTSIPRPFSTAGPGLADRNSWTVSTLAVENVVYPPIMPVPSTATVEGPSAPVSPSPVTKPRTSDPVTLMISVPRGNRLTRALTVPSSQRRSAAPTPPPTETRRSSSGLTGPPPLRTGGRAVRRRSTLPPPRRRDRARPRAVRTRHRRPSGPRRAAGRCRRRASSTS